MIEIVPEKVDRALLYFHSAGTDSRELRPFLETLRREFPTAYLWAGDGPISGSPMMHRGAFSGASEERYWFAFPMADAASRESFERNAEAMGAVLLSTGAYINGIVEGVKARFCLGTGSIVPLGFQHGSSAVLSAAMMRRDDPFAQAVLFEPFLLEAYYLKGEGVQPKTRVLWVSNEFIEGWTSRWLEDNTLETFRSYGIRAERACTPGGAHALDEAMLGAAISAIKELLP